MSKKALLKRRGQESIRAILAQSGGVYNTTEVAALLGISPEEISELVKQAGLLAIEIDGEHQFPTWQFDENGILPRFAEIIAMLDTASPVGVVRFFLTYDENLSTTAIAALKGNVTKDFDTVKTLARQFNNQVAR